MRLYLLILIFFISNAVVAKTIIVGPNQTVRSLKKAIELAKDKDTILLQAGIYKEGSITLTNP
jgi:nitrous oxidase accessory protein